MEFIYDELTNRFFKADIRELAIKERELNLRLAYDWATNEWKKTQITYNKLMFELFGDSGIQVGDYINFNMPIELEMFKTAHEDCEPFYKMIINEFRENAQQ